MKFRRSSLAPRAASISLLALCLMAHPATARAVRPGVNTEVALRRLKMSMPVDLQTVVDKNQSGLDFEDAETQKTAERQAREYISYHRHLMSDSKWQRVCHSDESNQVENPFCSYEQERRERIRVSKTNSNSKTEQRRIAADLESSDFDSVSANSYQQVIGGVAAIGDLSAITTVATHAIDHKTCLPSTVSYALGYKLEEGFPDPKLVDLSKALYRKSVDCGSDVAAATASFRLGLIKVWQHDCNDVKDLMLKTEKTAGAAPYHARAQYWRYYCAGQLKDEVAKFDARNSLLRDHPLSFQNLAVNGDDASGVLQVLQPQDPELAFRSLVRPELNSTLRGAEALARLDTSLHPDGPEKTGTGLRAIATDMIDHRLGSINECEPELRLYTAVLLNRMGSALPKFKILSNLFDEVPRMISMSTMKLYFPLWYFDLVKRKEAEIDPLLILSLIRQESAFNRQARSVVGARGLMQIMPATARGMSRSRSRDLFDPQTNISLGTTYLLKRLHQYGGDVELTLAAYNAGIGRVDDWRKRYPTENKMLFLDFIPFRETRDYVSMILRNYYWYVKLYDNSLDRTIATVTPSDDSPVIPLATVDPAGSSELARNMSEANSLKIIAGEISRTATTATRPSRRTGPKTAAIMSANAGLAAGVLSSP